MFYDTSFQKNSHLYHFLSEQEAQKSKALKSVSVASSFCKALNNNIMNNDPFLRGHINKKIEMTSLLLEFSIE